MRRVGPTKQANGQSRDDLVKAFDDVNQIFVRNPRESSAKSFGTERADLTDLYPRPLWQASGLDLHGQGESGPWLLAGQCHRNDSAVTFIEDIVAEYEHGPMTGLFLPAGGIEVRPPDLAPQYSGHAETSAASPSSARARS